MKKGLFLTALTATAILLTGCSTTKPEPAPAPAAAITPATAPVLQTEVQPILREEMQKLAAGITGAGGLAAVGTAESKNLELALNKAKVSGRIELTRMLNARVEALAKAFSEETGIPYESLLLSGFNNTTKSLSAGIAASVAQTLKYEQHGNAFAAYAVMTLDPKTIADRLAQEKDLYARLQPTKAFGVLTQEIKTYEAFKAAQK